MKGIYKLQIHVDMILENWPLILDVRLVVDVPAGVTQEQGHRISHPPFFCGACLNFSREKDSAVLSPSRP